MLRRNGTSRAAAAALGAALLLGGWGGVAHAEAPRTMRIGTVAPTGTPWSKIIKRYRKRVRAALGDQVQVKVFWSGKLGTGRKMVQQCLEGEVGAVVLPAAAFVKELPALGALELPYLFGDDAQVDAALQAARPQIAQILKARGIVLYMLGSGGWRHVTVRARDLRGPEGLKGLRIRTEPGDVHRWTWEALGAEAEPMPVADVSTALASGAVAGYDAPLLFGYAAQWSSEMGTVLLTGHAHEVYVFALCGPWLDALPGALRTALEAPPERDQVDWMKMVRGMDALLVKKLAEAGLRVLTPTDAERAALRRATAGVTQQFRDSAGEDGRLLLDRLTGPKPAE
jgi:TRAP-type C4-dicarboxylate transport system substrate-binding protein